MDTDYMQTISETQAIRHTCRTIMRETDVIVRDTAGTWTVNPAHDPDVWKAAHELHAAASSRADAIIAASLPAARVKCDRELRGERVTRAHADSRAMRRTARVARLQRDAHVGHVSHADQESYNVRGGWTVNRETVTLTRKVRWMIRTCVDVAARERIESERLAELLTPRSGSGLTRTHAAMERARAAGIIGWEPATLGAWDADSARDTINARETRAAERGRGRHRNAPSASKVSTRDAHGNPWLLKSLKTVGVATHTGASGTDYVTLLDTIMSHPTWATYRTWGTRPASLIGPWLTDTREGYVMPVHTPEAHTEAHVAAHAARVEPATRADRDRAIAASIGTVHAESA